MFRIVRTNQTLHPAFTERLAREPGLLVERFDRDGSPEHAWRLLSRAHAYQISAARDELPVSYHASAELLARCPHLLCVSSGGAGYDTVDVEACTRAGVLVLNQAGANAQSVAEATLGLIIDITHRLSLSDRRLRRERGFSREDLMGEEISGKTLGLIGIGHVGRTVARLAAAFGMTVIACDPLVDQEEIRRRGAEPVDLDALLRRADIVSVHCPRDAGTLGMMNEAAFARMKRGAFFVSTARGGIHDQRALLAALQSGQIRAAGLDVWEQEPPPLDDPLLQHESVVATYHTAGVTTEARARIALWAADQLAQVLAGGAAPRAVNPEVWPRFQTRLASAAAQERSSPPPPSAR
jgi:D-3-phosphoglycerate dehydrogenase